MEIASKYNPSEVEDKWYQYWLDHHLFHSEPDEREPYTIVIPPPNVTGVLHMGHMLNNTIQDILIRRARMLGKNACWVPGTDHASIATEAKVVEKLKKENIKKSDLTREQFIGKAWEWTHKHGGIILEQLKKLGASCDWDRTCFTMDDKRSESVIKVFVDLYNKGLIYRGVRMVNWDPAAQTALSDEEVNHKEQQGKLYYLRYKIVGENGYTLIATTRPETILGDTAVCIHPNDPKNAHLKGKRVVVPIANREVPIIEDDYVDIEFGTGCLKVTPAHDVNDYMLGEKHHLEVIDIFNDNGTLNGFGLHYEGKDRFVVRQQIVKELQESGLLEKTEEYVNKVGFSERTDVPIEPKLSMQWFVEMKRLAQPALEAVLTEQIKLHPAKFVNTYRHWMENVKDWCISRQLWWGHRIPAYFLPQGGYVVAETPEKALELAIQKTGDHRLTLADLRQDEDCLDTWFSSWLWPISVFDGINQPNNKDIQYYYPTNVLVTAPEILFFWVARMIISGYEYQGDKPFNHVYLTGIVRDKIGQKMSKSLGNSPEPIDLITQYGADGVRLGMLLTSPAGNDLPFDVELCVQGRNFANKIWNAFRLIKGWTVDEKIEQPESSRLAGLWFDAKLNQTLTEINDSFEKYRLSEALMSAYKLFWDEFSSWYLEIIKPGYQQSIDRPTYSQVLAFLDELLRLLHPFMPFITEELWQALSNRLPGDSIMLAQMPKEKSYNHEMITHFETVKDISRAIRSIRLLQHIPNKDVLTLLFFGTHNPEFDPVLCKMCQLSNIQETPEKIKGSPSFLIGTTEYMLPTTTELNREEELAKLKEELSHQQEFLDSVIKKLSNENFISRAPQNIIALERKKQKDAESKIQSIQENINSLT